MLNLLQQNETTAKLKKHIEALDELNQHARNICFNITLCQGSVDMQKVFRLHSITLEVDNIIKRIQGA